MLVKTKPRAITKKAVSKYIEASKLYVDPEDIAADRQRDPVDRLNHLVDLYGERGEFFSTEKAGAISVKARPNGMYAIKDGAGRWFAAMHLLDRPDMELLCVVMDETDDLEAFEDLNKGVHIPPGKMFMARGADPRNKYEYAVCKVLHDIDYTTTPGKGAASLKLSPVVFAYDLGVLRQVMALIETCWMRRKRRTEGIAISGLAGFLFLYSGDRGFDWGRVRAIMEMTPYEEFKESARGFLPKNKEHQRQWGAAMAKEFVTRYNRGLHKKPRIDVDRLHTLQDKVLGHKHYQMFAQVWEMRKIIK